MEISHAAVLVVERARALIGVDGFLARHRVKDRDFTRKRCLPFDTVMLLVLQKTIKSIQLHLHGFFAELTNGALWHSPTAGAWTQARAKLCHTAFIELNQVAVIDTVYAISEPIETWRGHRLVAIDSSTLRLPNNDALFGFFGGQETSNYYGECGVRVTQARLSVLYDCLNHIGIDTRIGNFRRGEIDLATEHFGSLRDGDIVVSDRGFAGYLFLARILAEGGQFVVRCSTQSFAAAKTLFKRNENGASITVTLPATPACRVEAKQAGLPPELRVRFVSVRLPSGDLEVLATSLLDEKAFPTEAFLEVYHCRWAIETYYGVLKGRLDLENFTGLTVEAVLQDIHAAVFLSNLESVVTRDAASQLPQPGDNGRLHGAKVNKAVSFHALKGHVIDLLIGREPVPAVLLKLRQLFLTNPVSIRPKRNPPRQPLSFPRSLHFQKRVKKAAF